ncbi:MAG: RNase adaptor protein RapZ, partial [Pseudomonadales bacterium]|nr:RNase adaptor protein RapZ [Pseudomonadales bacterium]
ALLFESFAYKNGVPVDADIVFDARCLPNPHWKPTLRAMTGLDGPVQEFLENQPDFCTMFDDIVAYLSYWLPKFEANNRSYMTIAIGCTGGQHRSVYLSTKLHEFFASKWNNVQIRHRELPKKALMQENFQF